jgi:hypothetical protein
MAVDVVRRRERRGPLTDRAGAEHIVAEKLELVLQPLPQLRQLVGKHRRIKAQSLMAYMARDDQERREAADELTRLNQEMGLL